MMRPKLSILAIACPPGARLRGRRGFTLLELITAVAISLVVLLGLYGLFIAQSRQFLYQDMLMNMNQNMRFAVDIITRSGRMAGYGTGGLVYGELGHDGTTVASGSTLPAVISYNAWDGEHDAVTFVYGDPALEMMSSLATLPCNSTGLSFPMGRQGYPNLISNYESGDLLLCWDYAPSTGTVSYLWSINAAGDATSGSIGIVSNSGAFADYDGICSSAQNLPPVLHCSRAQIITFYIDDTEDGIGPGSPEHPVLMMDLDFDFPVTGPSGDDIPLVDDIEDLQLAYCGPDSVTSNPDCSDPSQWRNSLADVSEMSTVWMVRVSVVSRSSKVDKRSIHNEKRPALEDHAEGSGDHYWRSVLTTSVTVRNLRMRYVP